MPPQQAAKLRLGPIVVTGLGLSLAIAGALAAPDGVPLSGLATRVFVPLPDWLLIAATAALSVAGVIFYVMVVTLRRAPKKDEEQPERYHEPQKIPLVLGVLLILLALTPAALLGGTVYWFVQSDFSIRSAGIAADAWLTPDAIDQRPVEPASPVTTGLIGTLALLASFGSLGLVLWLFFGDRFGRLSPGFARRHGELAAAIEDSLEDLRLEPDARAAIIKIYRNFERVLAAAALPRRPWQTPVEFMRAVLGKSPLPPAPMRSLTGLFELARFSRHPLGAAERESAWRSLIAIRAALDKERRTRDAAAS